MGAALFSEYGPKFLVYIFSTTVQCWQQNYVKKHACSTQCQDSNSQPIIEHKPEALSTLPDVQLTLSLLIPPRSPSCLSATLLISIAGHCSTALQAETR